MQNLATLLPQFQWRFHCSICQMWVSQFWNITLETVQIQYIHKSKDFLSTSKFFISAAQNFLLMFFLEKFLWVVYKNFKSRKFPLSYEKECLSLTKFPFKFSNKWKFFIDFLNFFEKFYGAGSSQLRTPHAATHAIYLPLVYLNFQPRKILQTLMQSWHNIVKYGNWKMTENNRPF